MKNSQLPTIDDCSDCGACCLHMGFPSYASSTGQGESDEVAWLQMPAELKQELQDYVTNYQQPADGELDGPCVWFDQQQLICKHHEHRPNVCRDFQVGGAGCVGWRDHYRIGKT